MAKVRDVKGVVGLEGVRVHNAVRRDLLLDDRQQGAGAGVGDDGGENLDPALEKPEHGNLAPRAVAPPATNSLINLLCCWGVSRLLR